MFLSKKADLLSLIFTGNHGKMPRYTSNKNISHSIYVIWFCFYFWSAQTFLQSMRRSRRTDSQLWVTAATEDSGVTSIEGPSGYEASRKGGAWDSWEAPAWESWVCWVPKASHQGPHKRGSGLHSREDEESKLLLLYFVDFQVVFHIIVSICAIVSHNRWRDTVALPFSDSLPGIKISTFYKWWQNSVHILTLHSRFKHVH